MIWGSLPQGPNEQAVQEFSKRLNACVKAESEDTLSIHSDCRTPTLCCYRLNDVILQYRGFALKR